MLSRQPGAERVVVNVFNHRGHIGLIQITVPALFGPDRLVRANVIQTQLFGGPTSQVADDHFNRSLVPLGDDMYVVRHDGTGPYVITGLAAGQGEPGGDGSPPTVIKPRGWMQQYGFGRVPGGGIVGIGRNGAAKIAAGCGPTGDEQLPRPDKIGPRPARIIGQPEPVRAENGMVRDDHKITPRG